MEVFNVRYMHALDAIFEDQQKEVSGWITRAQEIKNELRNTPMEIISGKTRRSTTEAKIS